MKFLTSITLPPLALVTVFLAVANRHRVLFSFDPFNSEQPALAFEAPLFAIVLAAVFAGMLIGGMAAWARQNRRRKIVRARHIAPGGDDIQDAAGTGKTLSPRAPAPDRGTAALPVPPPAAD